MGGGDTIVVLTPAPNRLATSKGDDAMISVTIQSIAAKFIDKRVVFATASDDADRRALMLGLNSARLFDGVGIEHAYRATLALNPSHIVVIGADVIDGTYDPAFSLRLVAVADLIARRGVPASILGFSVSKKPFRKMAKVFDAASTAVLFNLRDPVSYFRFKAMTSASSRLTADIAFLLPKETSAEVGDIAEWVDLERSAGRIVVGFNVHPAVLPLGRRNELAQLVKMTLRVIHKLADDHAISFVLLPHDFGGGAADSIVLEQIDYALKKTPNVRFIHSRVELRARNIKAFVSRLDAVISARMHLAIASLGSGVPVYGINYKDKMEGLFQHFGQGSESYSDVEDLLVDPSVPEKVSKFVREIDMRRASIAYKLPNVRELARLNFDVLDSAACRVNGPR